MNKIISTEKAPAAIGPYSQAVQAGNTLYVSGQLPIVPETGAMPDGIKEQTEQCLKNVGAILEKAGFGYSDVVKCTCLLADIKDFAAMNEVYAKFYPTNSPARAAFAVKDLPKGALVEIETIAAK
ncbi:MAG: RidA family protein [Bacteroidales bacterium]|nr:RidA family protein [Bacteroidales bacterium]